MQTTQPSVSQAEQTAIFKTKASRRPIVLYRRGDKSFAKFRLDAQNRVISIAKRHARNEALPSQDKIWLQEWTANPADEFGQLVIGFLKELEQISAREVQYH
jgi:predicted component of viral defense system (DUF524 family)